MKKLLSFADDERYTIFTNRDIFRLVIPLFIEQLLFIMVGTADTLMVAGLGEASISAVSLVGSFNRCVGSVLFALATGGAVVVSQHLGGGNLTRARESAKQLLVISLLSGTVIFASVELFLPDVVRILFGKLSADVHAGVMSYFRITLAGIPFIAVYGGCTALFRSMNRTKTTMYISFAGNIINIIGNALLIYYFRMGVAGAAYATLTSRFTSMLIILCLITNRSQLIYIDYRKGFRLSWQLVKKILSTGFRAGSRTGCSSSAGFLSWG